MANTTKRPLITWDLEEMMFSQNKGLKGYKGYDKTWPVPDREYVIQTSRQNFSIIIQAGLDSNHQCKTAIYNRAWFHKINNTNDSRSCGDYTGWTLEFYPN